MAKAIKKKSDDEVGNTCFILNHHKANAFCRARSLTTQYKTGNFHHIAIFCRG